MVNSQYGAEVWVEVGGQRMEEFQVNELSNTTQTCNIASKAGERFAICIRATSTRSRLRHTCGFVRVKVYADGVCIIKKTLGRCCGSSYFSRLDSVWESASTERLLEFGSLLLTDDESAPQGTERDIGELRIEINLVKKIEPRVSRGGGQKFCMPGDNPLHETSKKAASHAVRLGELRQSTGGIFSLVEDIPGALTHKVCFRYASIDHLRAQGVAPTPASTILPQEEGMSRDEANPGCKRKSDSKPPVETGFSSEDSLDNLTPEEKEMFARLKKKAQEGRKSKKPKLEHQDSAAGEIIVLSD